MAGRVRQPIDVGALERFLQRRVAEIKTPLKLEQFGFGQSNPTYKLTSPDGGRYVLRKKPPGKLLSKTAHKVEREYRIISALGNTGVPVPRTYCLCEDDAVIGTPFYIMEFLDGRIIEDAAMGDVGEEERGKMYVLIKGNRVAQPLIGHRWASAIGTLAALHRVDPDAVGLGSFGKRQGFYGRQIETWRTINTAQARVRDVETGKPVGQLPHFQELMDFFGDVARQPRDRACLVHGDFKIDNLMFHKTEPRVIGILDWEMSTIGHPLSDLVNMLTPYATARLLSNHPQHVNIDIEGGAAADDAALTVNPSFLPGETPGLPSLADCARQYAETAGWDPTEGSQLSWALAFGIFRLASICQGIAARYAVRQASSEWAVRHAQAREPLARFAWALVKEIQEGEKAKI